MFYQSRGHETRHIPCEVSRLSTSLCSDVYLYVCVNQFDINFNLTLFFLISQLILQSTPKPRFSKRGCQAPFVY